MAKKDNLLQLISSMSPSEKRHFKLSCGIVQGDKRYLRLFDALEKKSTYNATALSSELGLTAKQVADDKHYLNRILLNNLRSNVSLESETDILYNEFEDARHLVRRGLYTYAAEMAEGTLTRARDREQFDLMYNLLSVLHRCYSNLQNYERVHAIGEELMQLVVMSAEYNEMRWITGKATDYVIKGQVAAKDFDKLMQHKLMRKKPEEFKRELARAEWFETTFRYYCSKNNPHSVYKATIREWEYYKKRPEIKLRFANLWVLTLTRMINAEFAAKNFHQMLKLAEQMICELKEPAIRLTGNQVKYYTDYADCMLLLALHGLHENKKLLETAAKMIYPRKPLYQCMYLFYQAAALLNLHRPAEAIDKLNELLNLDAGTFSLEIKGTAKTVMILAQYDLGNYQILPHLLQATKLWLKRNKVVDKEDELLISLLGAIVKPSPGAAHKKAWLNLVGNIQAGKLKYICETIHFEKWATNHASKAKAL